MISAELTRFKTRIYEHCGLLLEGIAEDRLRKAIQKSAAQAGCSGLDAYYRLINSDVEVFDALISQLTVNETYFFREPEQIQLFSKVLIPRLLEHRSDHQPVRILSAGCSSGEEPYSLVMALQEEYGSRTRELFHFDAGDLDQQILAKARRGVYSAFSFRGVDEALQQRYFQPLQKGYQLSAAIREQVHLHELNLLAPVFPAHLKNYDLIFFRNVSIYFDMKTRQLIHRKFYDLMKNNGILLLGSSETLGNDLGVFELVEEAGQYFFVKGDLYKPPESQAVGWGQRVLPALNAVALQSVPAVFESVQPPAAPLLPDQSEPFLFEQNKEPSLSLPDLQQLRELVRDEQHSRAMLLLDRLLTAGHEMNVARLLKSWILLQRKDFQQAVSLLDAVLEADPWFLDALLMQGLAARWQQQTETACHWFKKATYTFPECWSAHYYLGDLYRTEGKVEAAIKAFQAARRVLSADQYASDGRVWIPPLLPPGDALFLSERNLLKLKQTAQPTSGKEG